MMRRQLPAYSPLSLGGIALAALAAARSPRSARASLRAYLAERFRAEHVCLTGSGTQALRLALEVAAESRRRQLARTSEGRSDPLVALPAYSCYDIVTAAVGANVRATFYDIDPVTLAPDMVSLEHAVDAGAEVVVVGNLFAFPVDWRAVRLLCEQAGALLIEDAAQGLGSGWDGSEAGTFGDFTVLSFGRGKGWTGGAGGALLVRGALEQVVREQLERPGELPARFGTGLRAALASSALWGLGRPWVYGLVAAVPGTGLGETRYREPEQVRAISAFSAACARRHADASRDAAALRRVWAGRWSALFAVSRRVEGCDASVSRCTPLEGGTCGWLRYPLVAGSASEAEAFVARHLHSGAARGYPKALPDLPQAAAVVEKVGGALPGARALAAGMVTLPTHPMVAERDIGRVTQRLSMTDGLL